MVWKWIGSDNMDTDIYIYIYVFCMVSARYGGTASWEGFSEPLMLFIPLHLPPLDPTGLVFRGPDILSEKQHAKHPNRL